jgi:hypothetical protein
MKEDYLKDLTTFTLLSWTTSLKGLPDLETLVYAVDEYLLYDKGIEEDTEVVEAWLHPDYF